MDNTFTVKINDEDVVLKVKKPSIKDINEAKKTYNETFNRAIQSKAPLRRVISNILKEQGLWSEEQQAQVDTVQKEILNLEFRLHKGGISVTSGRKLAIELREKRKEFNKLWSVHTDFDSNSAEGQAEDQQFNHLASLCIVYNSDETPFFKSYEEYISDTSGVSNIGGQKFAALVYQIDENYLESLPENVFLKQKGFVDDKLRLIDKQGRLIDADGKLINEDGYLIDEDGDRIDLLGHKLNKDGEFIVESEPFFDEE